MSKLTRIGKYILLTVILLAIGLAGTGILYRAYHKNEIRSTYAISGPDGIETLEKIIIGEAEQWIYIRSKNSSKPVLLFLHGGPGGSAMSKLRYFNSDLEDYFTVVNWDQRGAGKSYSRSIPEEMFNIEQFVADTVEMTFYLKERFETEKIYLLGHSWGTIIGIMAAYQYPHLYHAYIGTAQVVEPGRGEQISYQYALEAASEEGNVSALAELEMIGPAPYPMDNQFWDKLLIQRKWLAHYGGVVHKSNNLFP